jgi:hypothetical protein
MTEIGINRSGIDQKMIQGKDLGTFKSEQEALAKAKNLEGSELVYQDKDDKWHVAELKEEGVIYGSDAISGKDISEIELDSGKFKESKIKSATISFVEGNEFNFLNSGPVHKNEFEWAINFVNEVSQNNHQPSDLEKEKYSNIYNRYKDLGVEGKELKSTESLKPKEEPVSKEEFIWAKKLEKKVKSGEEYSPQEKLRYDGIYNRYKANGLGNIELEPLTQLEK